MGREKTIGKVLRCARIANDYKVKEAAELSDVTSAMISAVESGERKLSANTFERISEIYKLSPVQVMKLVEYYDEIDTDELKKYQLTVFKILEIILKDSYVVNKKRTENIYTVLKIARHANDMSVQTASSISGISAIYISQLEQGRRENISTEYLSRLAKAYNLTISQIEKLADHYENVDGGVERKFRLTLMMILEMIEANYNNKMEVMTR